jgi:hypothetical protein
MKSIQYILLSFLAIFLIACESGIDPITAVDPGPDQSEPVITINYPLEGPLIRVREDITSINIQINASDDIELASVTLSIDGTSIGSYSDFKDYRRAVISHNFEALGNGQHTLTVTATDLSGKTSTKSVNFEKVTPYVPEYDGEIFYMPFDGDLLELVSINSANMIGNSGFASGKVQNAYAGALDSYLTFPTKDESNAIDLLSSEFSASFWYNLNSTPDRAGILVIGPVDSANPTAMNNRNHGFRFFREGGPTNQTFKLNVGNGMSDSWFDGGAAATLNPETVDWVHLAFTISGTQCVVYFNGEIVSSGDFSGISWAGCDILSIASGAPRFTGWDHFSDLSLIDELRLFNKALTQAEIQAIIADSQ